MKLIIFGANGPTGLALCHQALAEGHQVTAAVRRPAEFPFQQESLTVVQANVMDGSSLAPVMGDADAALSALGTAYSRHEIRVYSLGTQAIVGQQPLSAVGSRQFGSHCASTSSAKLCPGPVHVAVSPQRRGSDVV
jgi:putative NADH-flavin reductase